MSEKSPNQDIPVGFEDAHEEWLKQGGETFQRKFYGDIDNRYYRTNYWKLVRQAVLARDKNVCFRCRGRAIQVHHLSYDHAGKDHLHPLKLVSICRTCHGLVEYARETESLLLKLRSTISSYQAPLGGKIEIDEKNLTYLYSKALQHRDELSRMRKHFLNGESYQNPKFTSPEDVAKLRKEIAAWLEQYRAQAENELKNWDGKITDKVTRIVRVLEQTARDCEAFIQEVFRPV